MSDAQIILSVAGGSALVVLPVFAYTIRETYRAGVRLEASIVALGEFLSIFGGLLAKDDRS